MTTTVELLTLDDGAVLSHRKRTTPWSYMERSVSSDGKAIEYEVYYDSVKQSENRSYSGWVFYNENSEAWLGSDEEGMVPAVWEATKEEALVALVSHIILSNTEKTSHLLI